MKLRIRSGVIHASWFVASSLAFASWAPAATVQLAPSQDNTLIETPAGNSNGSGDGTYCGRVGTLGGGTRRRALMAFDVSSIGATSRIDSVTLTLEMAQTSGPTTRIVSVYRASADWGEAGSVGSGSGAPAQPDDATWLSRFFAAPWPSPASGAVNLSYTLPQPARVSLTIYDAVGRVVRRLTAGVDKPAGRYATTWDGRTDSGAHAASGVYLACLVVDQHAYQHTIALLR